MKMQIFNKGARVSFLLAALILLFTVFVGMLDRNSVGHQKSFNQFRKVLEESRKAVKTDLVELSLTSPDKLFERENLNAKSQRQTSFFAYKNDSIRFWSSQSVAFPAILDTSFLNKDFILISNGYYLLESLRKGDNTYVGLMLIKNSFPYENEYLVNAFNPVFNMPDNTEIGWKSTGYDIFDLNQKLNFAIKFHPATTRPEAIVIILLVLYISVLVLIISGIYYLYRGLTPYVNRKRLLFAAFIADILILRVAMFWFKLPAVLYESKLFSPSLLAISNIIPSLGDLLINAVILLAIAWFFFNSAPQLIKKPSTSFAKVIYSFLLLFHVGVFFKLLFILLRSIVFDSIISFDLNNIFTLGVESLLGYIAIACLLLAYYFVSARIILIAISFSSSWRGFFILTIVNTLIFIGISIFFGQHQPVYSLFLLFYILSFLFFANRQKKQFTFIQALAYLAIFAFIMTYTFRIFKTEKEKQERILLAMEISGERDKVAEFRFQQIIDSIMVDRELKEILELSNNEENIETLALSHINQKHIDKFWQKYSILITICQPGKQLQIKPTNYIVDCRDYFNSYISAYSEPTSTQGLYYLFPGTGEINYLGRIELNKVNPKIKRAVTVYFEISSKSAKKGLGYPELLIDAKAERMPDMANYSYAIYQNSELYKSVGKYSFHLYDTNDLNQTSDYAFFSQNEFNHLRYKVTNTRHVLVSEPEPSALDILAPFSYLFIFFGLFILIFSVIVSSPGQFSISGVSFRNRIQYSMFALIFVSFIVIGISTLVYLVRLNYDKNTSILSEKSHSVLIELEHKLSDRNELNIAMGDYLAELLNKFSAIFFSDINLYDANGRLLASSRPQIFNEELISQYANPEAYKQLVFNKQSSFIHSESIGNYQYLSAYLPLRNDKNKLIGYLNLPYFARQGELRNEISLFLIAFTNIYVVLVAIGLFLALLLSNYLLRPLWLMKSQLRKIKLGNINQKIPWKSKDELGQLIAEYNRMTEELTLSAEMLARSERENAWREMAKQVAHEIKNPLTPMKLNIQHLQKAWKEDAPDWEQRLKRFATTLTEQIDALAEIATAFSDFATMPMAANEKVDLLKVAGNAADLFSDIENIDIIISPTSKSNDFIVLADERQILRVFNNLVKNAMQAIGNSPGGLININFSRENSLIHVEISDNGAGMSLEQQQRIFSPYFTTKTSGMGLGLAMVKNIITSFGGSVTFESQQGKGTRFLLYLPPAGQDE